MAETKANKPKPAAGKRVSKAKPGEPKTVADAKKKEIIPYLEL